MTRGYRAPEDGMHKWTEDLTGKNFGQLTVVSFAGYKGSPTKHAHWLCLCTCGDYREARATRLLHSQVVACAKCAKAAASAKGGVSRSLPGDQSAFRRLTASYKRNAIKRRLDFSLNEHELRDLFQGRCFYCGTSASQTMNSRNLKSTYTYSGIDRKDNSLGYVSGNVVSCCMQCNFAKRELSHQEFIDWISRVYDHSVHCGAPNNSFKPTPLRGVGKVS